jgi:hypothetical protein
VRRWRRRPSADLDERAGVLVSEVREDGEAGEPGEHGVTLYLLPFAARRTHVPGLARAVPTLGKLFPDSGT